MNVGIRDLTAHLSDYVGRAADGELIVVTDRGRPVAQLTALAGQSALLKRYLEERDSDVAIELMTTDPVLVTSHLTEVEARHNVR
jgi:prevent-host-death family protein